MNVARIGLTEVTARVQGEALLAAAARLQLSGVEPMIGEPDCKYLSWTPGTMGMFLSRMEELGVAVPSVALGAFNEHSSLYDPAQAVEAERLIRRSLKFTHDVGAGVMLFCTYVLADPNTPAKREALVSLLGRLAPVASNLGVTIALESPLPARELGAMVRAVGHSAVSVYYDVGNSIYLGFDVPAEIRELGSLIRAMHIKDTTNMLGDSNLGKGRLDLPGTFRALKEIRYDGWLMLETPSGNEPALREDIQLLKGLL